MVLIVCYNYLFRFFLQVFTMVLTLYKLDASASVRSVYMVINALEIPGVEYVNVDLLAGEQFTEEYLKINPQHTVPTLVDGDFVVWDSHAISVYLVTKYAKDDSLYPVDPQKRAIVDQRLHFDSGILFPALRSTAEPIIFRGETEYRQENLAKIITGYDFTEKFLTKTWIAGDDMTLADICCVSTICAMNEILPVDEKKYPKMFSWITRCSEKDFFKTGNVAGVKQYGELLRSKLVKV